MISNHTDSEWGGGMGVKIPQMKSVRGTKHAFVTYRARCPPSLSPEEKQANFTETDLVETEARLRASLRTARLFVNTDRRARERDYGWKPNPRASLPAVRAGECASFSFSSSSQAREHKGKEHGFIPNGTLPPI